VRRPSLIAESGGIRMPDVILDILGFPVFRLGSETGI
jgi:hypothetical protein